jgi:hypothetical protein
LGSGAWSFVPRGLRPVGGWTTGAGAGICGSWAGGGTFASGALQGSAIAGGARLIGITSPTAAADATDTERIRRIAGISHLSRSESSY